MTEFLPPANSKVLIEAGGKKEIAHKHLYEITSKKYRKQYIQINQLIQIKS